VFSTVHTNDSASTVTRLIDIGVEPYLVSSSLLLVIAQRLLRTLCPNCREPVTPTQEMLYHLEDLKLSIDQFPDGKLMKGKGCDECFRSGYAGRTAIYEVMPIDTHIQEQIVNKATASTIKRGALERGLKTLRMSGVQKLLHGMTTPDEVLRVTQLDVL
jgi:general secretion pathway protein E